MADLDRREQLMAAMDAAEEGNLEVPEEKDIESNEDPIQAENASYEEDTSSEEDNRDEKGRFKSNSEETSSQDDSDQESDMVAEDSEPTVDISLVRPTTWKKEYLPIWDKLTSGEQLTKEEALKLAKYSNQRESEYKKGVSTYKAEADRARELDNAIAPFIPELQAQNISPSAWINNLGRAHMILTKAPMEQKVQMFQRLAQDYGIQLNQDGQMAVPQVDAYTQQLMNQLNQVNQEVSSIKGRFQQEEQARLSNEIERVRSNVEKFPHFDVVREEMAQLLELGKAQDLETAYAKAVRLNDDVWAIEQERLLKSAQKQASKASQVARAKAAAVSPKSVTPSGKVASSDDKKDRRSLIAEQLGEAMSRRV